MAEPGTDDDGEDHVAVVGHVNEPERRRRVSVGCVPNRGGALT